MESPDYYRNLLAKAPTPAQVVDAYRFALLKWAAGVAPSIAFGAAPHVAKRGWHVRQRVEGNLLRLTVTVGGLALYGADLVLPERDEVHVQSDATFYLADGLDAALPHSQKLKRGTNGFTALHKGKNLGKVFAQALASARTDYLTTVAP